MRDLEDGIANDVERGKTGFRFLFAICRSGVCRSFRGRELEGVAKLWADGFGQDSTEGDTKRGGVQGLSADKAFLELPCSSS